MFRHAALGSLQGPPRLDEESWWLEVLHDPRARWPTENRLPAQGRHAHLRLERCRRDEVTLACDLCGADRRFAVADLLQRYGGDFNMVVLRHKLVPCRARSSDAAFGPCRLRWEHW